VTRAYGVDSGLELNGRIADVDDTLRLRLLHLISGFAGLILHEMTEKQQAELKADELSLTLFQDVTPQSMSNWGWLVGGKMNVLCFGILEGLHPPVLTQLVSPRSI
jgi:hypothetical protein